MARIFMDGGETGDTSFWSAMSNSGVISSTVPAGMSGTYVLYLQSSHGLYRSLPSSKSELYVAFKWYSTTGTISACSIFSFRDSASTVIYSLRRSASGFMEAHLGTKDDTLNATGTKFLQITRTFLIEIYYKPLNSGGSIIVKIDGVEDINYSGDTTAGLENIKSIHFGYDQIITESAACYFDDVVVDDASWIGNTKVGIIVPDGTGTTNNWTASAGNAWDCLNEKPPVDTDYVYSNTTNQIATYAMTTIASMNTIKAVQLQGRAAYEGSPTPTKIQLGIRASGADYFATDLSPGISFGMLAKILELNPADFAAWEQADIDALEVGVKATA